MGKNKKQTDDFKVIISDLGISPFRMIRIAFALMGVIPLLILFYLMIGRNEFYILLLGGNGLIVSIAIFLSLMGFIYAYRIVARMLKKLLVYSYERKCAEEEKTRLITEIEEKNQKMQKELELAMQVHKRLIPKSVNTDFADLDVVYLPMSYMGGDYAKFHFIDKDKLVFIICDITGHGVSAAILVNTFHTEFERLIREGRQPGVLLRELDDFIARDFADTNMYLTAFCGLLDYTNKKFIYSNYGHPPQYIYKTINSQIRQLGAQTSFLGLPFRDEIIYQDEMSFEKGDQILLFTDGVTETTNKHGEWFGKDRLENFIKNNYKLHPNLFNKKLLDELIGFNDQSFRDDVFLLSIAIK